MQVPPGRRNVRLADTAWRLPWLSARRAPESGLPLRRCWRQPRGRGTRHGDMCTRAKLGVRSKITMPAVTAVSWTWASASEAAPFPSQIGGLPCPYPVRRSRKLAAVLVTRWELLRAAPACVPDGDQTKICFADRPAAWCEGFRVYPTACTAGQRRRSYFRTSSSQVGGYLSARV